MTFPGSDAPRRAVPPWRRPLFPCARPRPAPAPRAAGSAGRGAGPGGLRPQRGRAARAPARRRHARAGRRRAAGLDPAGRSAGALQHAAVVPRRRQDRRTPGAPGRCRDARPDRGPAGSGRRRQNAASARAQLSAAQHQLDYAKQQLDRDRAQARARTRSPPPSWNRPATPTPRRWRSATRPRSNRRWPPTSSNTPPCRPTTPA